MIVLDRLIAPWGTIGVALLVLAWLERNVALLLFTVGVPGGGPAGADRPSAGDLAQWGSTGRHSVPQLVINGAVLLLGAIGFALAAAGGTR